MSASARWVCSGCGTEERRLQNYAIAEYRVVVCWKNWPECGGTLIQDRRQQFGSLDSLDRRRQNDIREER